ncbi:MAG: META domain-containing protein [Chryseotalea sp.]
MKNVFLICLVAAILVACHTKKENAEEISFQKVLGTYEGIMPCADCTGIFIHVELLDSVTFLKETRYLGKSRKTFHSNGSWKIVNDTTIQLNSSGLQEIYTYKNAKLILQNAEGKNIPEASFMQALYQPKTKSDSSYLFEANDEQASWRLLANGESVVFLSNNGDSVSFVKPVFEQTETELNIRAQQNNETIKISLKSLGCINNNQTYQTYITLVDWKGKLYTGCGDMIHFNQLHGKWVADEINGWSFPKDKKQEQVPYLFFNPFSKSVNGLTGCNRFTGTYKQKQNQITFGAIASTKMYCSGSAENFFLQVLKDANAFELRNENLLLKKDDLVLMVLHAE